MLSPIIINGNTIKQPTSVRDYRIKMQVENTAIDGTMQRNRIISSNNPVGFKYAADLVWEDIGGSDYLTLLGLFASGSGIVYTNPATKYGALTYSGLPFDDDPDVYIHGDSLLTKYTVTIRQI